MTPDPRPKDASTVRSAVRRLRRAGDLEGARAVVEEALVRSPGRAGLLALAGELALEAGDLEYASARLRRALDRAPRPRPDWSLQLGRALVQGGGADDDVDGAYWAAIVGADPSGASAFEEWIGVIRSRGVGVAELARVVAERQRDEPVPVAAALAHVLAAPTAEDHRVDLACQLERFERGPAAASCRDLWTRVCALQEVSADDCAEVLALPRDVVRLFFLLSPPALRDLEGLLLAPGDLAAHELSTAALRSYRDSFLTSAAPLDVDPEFASAEARELLLRWDRLLGYQTRAVEERALWLADPHTGAAITPFDSTTVYSVSAYSFGDRELSILITAGESKRAVGILIAGAGIIVDFGADLDRYVSPARMSSLLSVLLLRVARDPARYSRAVRCPSPTSSGRSVSLMLGAAENFAHHLWNYYPGLENLISRRLVGNVSEIRVRGSEFFGRIDEVFPELAGVPIVEDPPRGRRDPHPFDPHWTLVQPSGIFVQRAVLDRVVGAMARRPPGASALTPPAELPFPVVWIGLRVGSRSWLDQERHIPAVAARIWALWPDALLLLDGYSYPVGRDGISHHWAAAVDKLRVVARRVIETVERPDQVIDMVGNTLRESVLWADRADTYVTPMGTSQHKVGWFCRHPGTVYAPPSIRATPHNLRSGAWEAEGAPIPTYLIGTPVEPGERRTHGDRRAHLENLVLDPTEVSESLLDHLRKRATTR